MRALLRRLLATVRRTRAERDLDAEVRFHLQSLADEFEAKGLDAHAARLAARRAFGGVEQIKEVYRERRGLPLVDGALRDLRHTARSLLRSPGFTAIVVGTIALAIGANAAVFLLLDQVVLRPLPVARPSELAIVSVPPLPVENGPKKMVGGSRLDSDGRIRHGATYPLYQTLRRRIPLFHDALAHRALGPIPLAGTTPILADAELVTGNYFDVLGIKAAIGRTLRADDDRAPAGSAVAVLSHGFWQRQFGGDPSVLNRTIRLNNCPLTIVGVAAQGFSGTGRGRGPDLFVPLTMSNQVAPIPGHDLLSNQGNSMEVIARLAPGVSREQAEKYLRGVYETLFDEAAGRIYKTSDLAGYKARYRTGPHCDEGPGANERGGDIAGRDRAEPVEAPELVGRFVGTASGGRIYCGGPAARSHAGHPVRVLCGPRPGVDGNWPVRAHELRRRPQVARDRRPAGARGRAQIDRVAGRPGDRRADARRRGARPGSVRRDQPGGRRIPVRSFGDGSSDGRRRRDPSGGHRAFRRLRARLARGSSRPGADAARRVALTQQLTTRQQSGGPAPASSVASGRDEAARGGGADEHCGASVRGPTDAESDHRRELLSSLKSLSCQPLPFRVPERPYMEKAARFRCGLQRGAIRLHDLPIVGAFPGLGATGFHPLPPPIAVVV